MKNAAALHFFNTLTRKNERFQCIAPPHVKMYTCGPTVYHFAHIGNFRTYVFEDLLRRTLAYFGYQVEQVMNITDIDDKTLKGAIAKGCSLEAFTNPYTEAFFEDLKTLRIQPAEHYPRATQFIPQMIHMIETLIEKKLAYQGQDKSIYFAIRAFPNYGCLSHLHLDELKEGASKRVQNDEYDKESASDFVLWKAYDSTRDGQIFWESPFGPGRPGWHLECSAMAMTLLGKTLDIHVGAVDNIFPHHENEIAQSEGCSGSPFVKFWLHSEHLIVDGKKMSKSLGNFFTLRDLLNKGITGREVRFFLLSQHYKTQLNFTFEGVEASKQTLQRIDGFIRRLRDFEPKIDSFPETLEALIQFEEKVEAALADDLNTPQLWAAFFDFIRTFQFLMDQGRVDHKAKQRAWALIEELDRVVGVILVGDTQDEEAPPMVAEALVARANARKEKNWAESDRQRDIILAQGYRVEDTAKGQQLTKIR